MQMNARGGKETDEETKKDTMNLLKVWRSNNIEWQGAWEEWYSVIRALLDHCGRLILAFEKISGL